MASQALISCQWLKEHLEDSKLIIFDASMTNTLPGITKSSTDNFIPRAQHFDFDQEICQQDNPLPHMLPTAEQFTQQIQEKGVNHDSLVVIYDSQGIYSAPRVWWMLKTMGFNNAYILDGGLPAWLKDTFPTTNRHHVNTQQGNFIAKLQIQWLSTSQDILSTIDSSDTKVLDARSTERFTGSAPEPRAGLRSGHIPNAISLPFTQLLDNGHYKSLAQLQSLFSQLKADKNNRLICSCGSGITACIILFAAYLIGYRNLSVYDGSWVEWGANNKLPIASE